MMHHEVDVNDSAHKNYFFLNVNEVGLAYTNYYWPLGGVAKS